MLRAICEGPVALPVASSAATLAAVAAESMRFMSSGGPLEDGARYSLENRTAMRLPLSLEESESASLRPYGLARYRL